MSNENSSNGPRITVAEAIHRVSNLIANNTDKNRFPDEVSIYAEVALSADGTEFHPPNGKTVVKHIDGKDRARRNLRSSFFAFCKATGTVARSLHNPWQTESYTGGPGAEDYRHDISTDEYEKWAAPYLPRQDDQKALPAIDRAAKSDPSERWEKRAARIADELFDRDTAAGCRDSLKGYAGRVMDEMQIRGIKGPRGIIDNPNTIQREALQSELWWAEKKK